MPRRWLLIAIFELFCLQRLICCLEFEICVDKIDRHLRPEGIGKFLHSISDVVLLAKLLESSPLPLYNYYLNGCHFLTWPRIRSILKARNTVSKDLHFTIDALLSPTCLAVWPGLWKSQPRRLETLLDKHPQLNPLYAFGNVCVSGNPSRVNFMKQKIREKTAIFNVLLEAANSAMLQAELFAESALVDLVACEVVDLIDPVRFPRLFTSGLFAALYDKIDFTQIEALPHWEEVDRLIWSLNYCQVCWKAGLEVGNHLWHPISRLFDSLQPTTRTRKTRWSRFMRELLRPEDGICARALKEIPSHAAQVKLMEEASLDWMGGAFSDFLIYRWLESVYPDSEVWNSFSSIAATKPNRMPYSALQLFGHDAVALKAHLETNIGDPERIPLFIAYEWIFKRRIVNWHDGLIEFFSFPARRRLFRQYTKIHGIALLTQDVAYEMCFTYVASSSMARVIMNDFLAELRDEELLNIQDLTAIMRVSESKEKTLILPQLFSVFLENIFDSNRGLFTLDKTGAHVPRPYIRPKLWFYLGRFFTLAFKLGIRFPGLKLKKSVFVAAFNQRFEASIDRTSSFISFADDANVFQFNTEFSFPEIVNNCSETPETRRALIYALNIDSIEESQKLLPGEGSDLYDSNPPSDFNTRSTETFDGLVRAVTGDGMFKFWIGLEPLVSFFTADEVYNALFNV